MSLAYEMDGNNIHTKTSRISCWNISHHPKSIAKDVSYNIIQLKYLVYHVQL